ncbi:MAG: hypothetical protein Kow0079_00040 [Vicingaceae bacterium]
MKKLTLFILVLSCFEVFGQYTLEFFADTNQSFVSTDLNFQFGSNAINNKFFKSYYLGEYIDEELKATVKDKLKANNYFGGDLNINLLLKLKADTLFNRTDLYYLFGMEQHQHTNGSFSEDAFNLTFYGNKMYAGKDADISGLELYSFTYQAINFGLMKETRKNGVLAQEGFLFSIIKGQQNTSFLLTKGNLFTDEFGQFIDLDAQYFYNSSDTAQTGLSAFNGWGIATDLFTVIPFRKNDVLKVSIEDIGFINWNKNSIEVTGDTTYHFEGVEITNLFNLNDSLLNQLSKDSIVDNLNATNKKRKYAMSLPTAISLSYYKNLKFNNYLLASIRYQINTSYRPFFALGYRRYLSDNIAFQTVANYGGYEKLGVGFGFSVHTNNGYYLNLQTNHLEAFFIPQNSFGINGVINLAKTF